MARIEKRLLNDGSTRYKAIVRRTGAPMRTKTFRTRAQAIRWGREIDNLVDDRKALPTRVDEQRTVNDVIGRYRLEILPDLDRKGQSSRSNHLAWWSKRIGDLRVSEVGLSVIDGALRALARGETPSGKNASPATRNRYLATLRHAFSIARRRWEWIDGNPISGLAAREPRGRVRFLDEDERTRLLHACRRSKDARLYPLVVLAVSTGARQGELLRLRWADVDLIRGVAVVLETKNDERRALPLAGHALEVLQERSKVRRINSDLLFANERGRASFPRIAWKDAVQAARLEDFRFHDLRHSAASYLAMSGATLAEIADVLGHKTLAMVKRYSHLTEQHTSAVVARMNERFLADG
jgi:integrase